MDKNLEKPPRKSRRKNCANVREANKKRESLLQRNNKPGHEHAAKKRTPNYGSSPLNHGSTRLSRMRFIAELPKEAATPAQLARSGELQLRRKEKRLKHTDLVDLKTCYKMSLYLQNRLRYNRDRTFQSFFPFFYLPKFGQTTLSKQAPTPDPPQGQRNTDVDDGREHGTFSPFSFRFDFAPPSGRKDLRTLRDRFWWRLRLHPLSARCGRFRRRSRACGICWRCGDLH